MKRQYCLVAALSLILCSYCADGGKKDGAKQTVKNNGTEADSGNWREFSASSESPKTLQLMEQFYNQGYQKGYDDGYTAALANHPVKVSTDTANIKIAINDLKKLVAEIVYSHDRSSAPPDFPNKVLSTTFEAYSILNTEEPAAIYRYVDLKIKKKFMLSENEFYNYFIVQDTMRVAATNEMLVVMRDCNGFEFVPYVFAIFGIAGDQLVLKGLLDELYGAGIGKLWVEEMIKVSSDGYVLQGRAGGGDAGDHWGSLWFGYWKRPLHLQKLYEKRYFFESEAHEYPSATEEKKLTAKLIKPHWKPKLSCKRAKSSTPMSNIADSRTGVRLSVIELILSCS